MDLYQTLNIYDLNIGDVIRNYLKTHHLTQHQFAEDVGLSKSKVDRLFQSRTIDTSLLVVISKALKYNFFALYAGDARNDNNCETIENIHIGKLIELKLKESNLSQAQLAERLKMNQPVVSKLIKKESVDTGTPQGKFMLTVFGAMAELERETILQRQREGIAVAKAQGKYKGRKPKEIDLERMKYYCIRWRNGEITTKYCMSVLNLKPNTFYRRVKEYGL